MKSKTIRIELRRKLNEWLESIGDESIRELAGRDVFVAGGSIASMLLGEKVNDYDLFFRTKETALALAKYYVDLFRQNPPDRIKNDPDRLSRIDVKDDDGRIRIVNLDMQLDNTASDEFADAVVTDAKSARESAGLYRPVSLTPNAITLTDQIQIVIRFYGQPKEVFENFDFVHCVCHYDLSTHELHLPAEALEALLARELRYKRSLYPLCAIIRTRKFIRRGWRITAGQYLKMAYDLNELDLHKIEVLQDQLVGVDSAYFAEVLNLLLEKDGDIDRTYLIEVIDKVFDA